jgi:hypothetical protein
MLLDMTGSDGRQPISRVIKETEKSGKKLNSKTLRKNIKDDKTLAKELVQVH